ncbi:MAG: hypothetical protein ACLP9L_28870 [Thermoguttaceae bacterium]
MNQYPRPDMKHLVQRVEGAGAEEYSRDWTGNDGNGNQHHSIVSLDESPLRLLGSSKYSAASLRAFNAW